MVVSVSLCEPDRAQPLSTSLHAGMGDLITVQQRNIEEYGFPETLHGKADGVFLDLPGPWHVSTVTLFTTCSLATRAQSCGLQQLRSW